MPAFLDKQILNDHLTKAKNNPKYDCQKEILFPLFKVQDKTSIP